MKKRKSHVNFQRVFACSFFLFIVLDAWSQWTYTATVTQTGSCIPYPQLSGVQYYTKSACEAARQYDLSQNGSDWSTFSGDCQTVITCTPCMGSDIGNSNQISVNGSPENLMIDAAAAGKAFFSSHRSKDIESWMNDYWVKLKARGIPYDIANIMTIYDVPLTGNPEFDQMYLFAMSSFLKTNHLNSFVANNTKTAEKNPPTQPVISQNESEPKTVPLMGGSPMTDEERQRQKLYKELGYVPGYDMYAFNVATDNKIEEPKNEGSALSKSQEYKTMEYFFDKIGDIKGGGLPAEIGKGMLKFVDNTFTFLTDATINNKYTAEELENMSPAFTVVNTLTQIRDEKIEEYVNAPINKLKGAVTNTYKEMGIAVISAKTGVDSKIIKTDLNNSLTLINEGKKIYDLYNTPKLGDIK